MSNRMVTPYPANLVEVFITFVPINEMYMRMYSMAFVGRLKHGAVAPKAGIVGSPA